MYIETRGGCPLLLHSDAGVHLVVNVKGDLLLSRDVALSYGGAIHLGHLHVVLDLSEIQAQVLATNSHERAALPGPPERFDLLKYKS